MVLTVRRALDKQDIASTWPMLLVLALSFARFSPVSSAWRWPWGSSSIRRSPKHVLALLAMFDNVMAGCAVQSGGVVTTIIADVSVTHRMAPSPPPPPMPSDLANLDFAILWRQIDDEGLPVKKNVGGPEHRTLDEMRADVAMARAVPYLSAAPGS